MLLQFTASNFKSFDEPTAFSMRAGGDKDHPSHVMALGKYSAVRTAAIYGANAAGKSNLVLAMGFARDLIMRQRGATIRARSRFRLSGEIERPSGFHWSFLYEARLWNYGFEVNGQRVAEEYLFVQDQNGGKEQKWFERTTDADKQTKVKWGPAFLKSLPKDEAQLLELSTKPGRLPEDELVLWRFIDSNSQSIKPLEEWFREVLVIAHAEAKMETLATVAHKRQEFLEFLSEFLKFADTGIDCLVPKRRPFKKEWVEADPDDLEERLAALEPGTSLTLLKDYTPAAIEKDDEGQLWFLELVACHKKDDGSDAEFPLDWESSGTQRLIHLLAGLFRMKDAPTVFVIDEIERRFHPKLTRRLVELAQQSPVLGNQLIFTTHETALLDSLLLRRDEIFFARKKQNRTTLERLNEYPIRNDRSYEKAYELGRIGGGGPELSYRMFSLMEEDEDENAAEASEVNAIAAS